MIETAIHTLRASKNIVRNKTAIQNLDLKFRNMIKKFLEQGDMQISAEEFMLDEQKEKEILKELVIIKFELDWLVCMIHQWLKAPPRWVHPELLYTYVADHLHDMPDLFKGLTVDIDAIYSDVKKNKVVPDVNHYTGGWGDVEYEEVSTTIHGSKKWVYASLKKLFVRA